jgi:hypothetical protein
VPKKVWEGGMQTFLINRQGASDIRQIRYDQGKKGGVQMNFKDITRRDFFQKVVKYCGAGVAAVGLVGLKKKSAHAVDDWICRPIQVSGK